MGTTTRKELPSYLDSPITQQERRLILMPWNYRCQIPYEELLLGHADNTMLSHYDNVNAKRFMEQVEEAHMAVLRDFKAEELMNMLLNKIKAINVPEWIYDGTLYLEEKAFWKDYQKSVNHRN